MDNHPVTKPTPPPSPRSWVRVGVGIVAILAVGFVSGFASLQKSISKTIETHVCNPPPDIRVYFSPRGGAKDAIIDLINGAKQEICLAIYSFTDPDLAYALIAAHRRKVAVHIIHDRSQNSARGSQIDRLTWAGINVQCYAYKSLLHHKFMVVDQKALVTGSMNWTKNGENRNAENTLIYPNYPDLATKYHNCFERLQTLQK